MWIMGDINLVNATVTSCVNSHQVVYILLYLKREGSKIDHD